LSKFAPWYGHLYSYFCFVTFHKNRSTYMHMESDFHFCRCHGK
jgi:hypothetical protein